MSGIRRGQVVRISRAGRSPGHEHAFVPTAEEAQVAVTDEIETTAGIAVADPGIVSKGAGA